jgi:hypothetical protein
MNTRVRDLAAELHVPVTEIVIRAWNFNRSVVTADSALPRNLEEAIRSHKSSPVSAGLARPQAPRRPKRQPWPRLTALAPMELVLARDEMKRRDPYWYGAPDERITPDEYRVVQRRARDWVSTTA